jgi:hypothetical protein
MSREHVPVQQREREGHRGVARDESVRVHEPKDDFGWDRRAGGSVSREICG